MKKLILIVVVALSVGTAAVAASGQPRSPASPAAAAGKPKLQLKILSPSQSVDRRRRRQRPRHRSRPQRAQRSGQAAQRPAPARLLELRHRRSSRRLADPTVLKINKAGTRTLTVPLGEDAARKLAGCEARTLRARVRKHTATADLVRTGACAPQPIDLSRAADCDFIGAQQTSSCMLPFPDDFYTVADPSSATGRRVDLHAAAMPDNAAGKPIDPEPYALNDGFSPGETILARVPGLDNPAALAQTDAAPLNHIGRYAEPDAPVVVIDAETGERLPIWVEIDSNATAPDSTPARDPSGASTTSPGHRYIVAMRDLRRADGSTIDAPEGFRYYRDELPSDEAAINDRRDHFESIFEDLSDAGIRRAGLYLAWDFTVASDDEHRRAGAAHARRRLRRARRHQPRRQRRHGRLALVHRDEHRRAARPADRPPRLRHLRGALLPRARLRSGRPLRAQRATASPTATGPTRPTSSASSRGAPPALPSRSWRGRRSMATASSAAPARSTAARPTATSPSEHGFVMCATDEIGMSGGDVRNTIANILTDLSNFPMLTDRLQQGLLERALPRAG